MFQFKRPSAFSVIVAVLAIFAIGGGTATAAKLITGKQIKDNTITGKDIKKHSIKLSDIGFYNGDGAGDVFTVDSGDVSLPPGADVVDVLGPDGLTAQCPNGTRVIGTGFNGSAGITAFVESFGPFVGAYIYNPLSTDAITVSVQAICAYGWDGDAALATASGLRSARRDYAKAAAAAARSVARR